MKNTAILIIHGFGGNLDEIIRLKTALEKKDYNVKCPIIAGHGKGKKELSSTDYNQWISSINSVYDELNRYVENVVIVGFSMGGLIGVNLCTNKMPKAIITINTPIYYWNIKQILDNLAYDFTVNLKKYFKLSIDKSAKSLVEFLKILYYSKNKFCKITCPSLIIQSLDDDTVNPKSAEFIFKSVSGVKQKIYYSRGGHLILKSGWTEDIADKIDNFICKNIT